MIDRPDTRSNKPAASVQFRVTGLLKQRTFLRAGVLLCIPVDGLLIPIGKPTSGHVSRGR